MVGATKPKPKTKFTARRSGFPANDVMGYKIAGYHKAEKSLFGPVTAGMKSLYLSVSDSFYVCRILQIPHEQ